jgi:hypothetical protein
MIRPSFQNRAVVKHAWSCSGNLVLKESSSNGSIFQKGEMWKVTEFSLLFHLDKQNVENLCSWQLATNFLINSENHIHFASSFLSNCRLGTKEQCFGLPAVWQFCPHEHTLVLPGVGSIVFSRCSNNCRDPWCWSHRSPEHITELGGQWIWIHH